MTQARERVYAIDLARGMAVAFMILVHALIAFGSPEVMESPFGETIGFLGGPPAAPVFMAAMGISFYYSRNRSLAAGVKRGLYIILLGYVLNIFRNVLPVWLAEQLVPAQAAAYPAQLKDYANLFLELDILQFAGLSLIAMAFIRALKVNRNLLLIAAAAIMLVSPALWSIKAGNPVADHLLDYLWGDEPMTVEVLGNLVSFPFFPWFTYVLVGMYLGDTLTSSGDANRVMTRIGIAGLAITAASLAYITPNFKYHMNDYYHGRPAFTLFTVGIVLAWLSVCHLLAGRLRGTAAFRLLTTWSTDVNRIYILQWVLIMSLAALLTGFNEYSYPGTIAMMAVVFLGTHYLNAAYVGIRARRERTVEGVGVVKAG